VSQEGLVERTFRFASSRNSKNEGLQPLDVPPAETGSELKEDAALKGGSTRGILP